MPRILPVLLAILSIGCVSQSSLDGFRLPNEAREQGLTFAVLHQPDDKRGLDKTIAETLRARGLNITADAKKSDYIVSYVDRWHWDMRTYLIDLRIDIREAKTNVLVGTGRSYQTSLSAMGDTHRNIIERTVDVLVNGIGAAHQTKAQRRQRTASSRR